MEEPDGGSRNREEAGRLSLPGCSIGQLEVEGGLDPVGSLRRCRIGRRKRGIREERHLTTRGNDELVEMNCRPTNRSLHIDGDRPARLEWNGDMHARSIGDFVTFLGIYDVGDTREGQSECDRARPTGDWFHIENRGEE